MEDYIFINGFGWLNPLRIIGIEYCLLTYENTDIVCCRIHCTDGFTLNGVSIEWSRDKTIIQHIKDNVDVDKTPWRLDKFIFQRSFFSDKQLVNIKKAIKNNPQKK